MAFIWIRAAEHEFALCVMQFLDEAVYEKYTCKKPEILINESANFWNHIPLW